MKERLPPSDVELPQQLWQQTSLLLHHAAARANKIVTRHLDGPGGRMHYAILSGLEEFDAMGQGELCDRLGIDRGDAVAALTVLEAADFVRRRSDPRDGRRNIVEITDLGRVRLGELKVMIEAAQSELVQSMSDADHLQLNVLLRRLIDPV